MQEFLVCTKCGEPQRDTLEWRNHICKVEKPTIRFTSGLLEGYETNDLRDLLRKNKLEMYYVASEEAKNVFRTWCKENDILPLPGNWEEWINSWNRIEI